MGSEMCIRDSSIYFLEARGVTKNTMLVLRSAGLIGIGLTTFLTLLIALPTLTNAYVFQNQPKAYANVGLPYEIGGNLIGGSLLLFNIFEMFAVAAGFTLVFILLAIPETEVLKMLRGEEVGH